jgi:hypothetical protein
VLNVGDLVKRTRPRRLLVGAPVKRAGESLPLHVIEFDRHGALAAGHRQDNDRLSPVKGVNCEGLNPENGTALVGDGTPLPPGGLVRERRGL